MAHNSQLAETKTLDLTGLQEYERQNSPQPVFSQAENDFTTPNYYLIEKINHRVHIFLILGVFLPLLPFGFMALWQALKARKAGYPRRRYMILASIVTLWGILMFSMVSLGVIAGMVDSIVNSQIISNS